MKVTLVMAMTINGYVAGANDDTEWVKDFELFYKTVADWGVAVMGRRTYEESDKYNAFPYKGALNIVMTHNPKLLKIKQENALFINATPEEVVKLVAKKGHKKLLVIGGGQINGNFLKAGLIDEIIIDIHPLIISNGVRLFESEFPYQNLELISYKEINDQILQVKYKVKK